MVHKSIGIRLERKKEASLLNWNLKRPYPPEKVCIPLREGALACVRPGENVRLGQKIADPQGSNHVTAHASIPGTVTAITAMPDAFGTVSFCVEIKRSHDTKIFAESWEMRKEWEQLSAERLIEIFRQSGLVTTDSAMEPVHAKVRRHPQTIIINGCEPEPYVTCEQILTMAHPVEILHGAEILRKATGAGKIVFAFEQTNLEMIELMKSKIFFLKWRHVEIRTVPALYPQGMESTLLQEWFGGKADSAIVFPVSTAFAVYEAVVHQKPFYERIVTVGGECVVEPRSLWLPIGISFYDAIHACKGVMRGPRKVVMNGPMSGVAQTSLAVPVMAGTSAVLALPQEMVQERDQEPCIRCHRCVDACPVSISPVMMTLAAEQGELDLAEEWGASFCIQCGNCGYVCPSNRPMIELIRSVSLRQRFVPTMDRVSAPNPVTGGTHA